jgi:hypothetical protein
MAATMPTTTNRGSTRSRRMRTRLKEYVGIRLIIMKATSSNQAAIRIGCRKKPPST